ncbi:MAG: flagellar biosynthetic protein FliO [Rhodothermaceae bacterium]
MQVSDYLYMFFVLALLLGVMYLLLFLMKKYLYSFNSKGNKKIKMEVLNTQAILPKKFVSAVKINDKVYLLGISEQSVNLIDKLDDIEIVEDQTTSVQSEYSFKEIFKKNLGMK